MMLVGTAHEICSTRNCSKASVRAETSCRGASSSSRPSVHSQQHEQGSQVAVQLVIAISYQLLCRLDRPLAQGKKGTLAPVASSNDR